MHLYIANPSSTVASGKVQQSGDGQSPQGGERVEGTENDPVTTLQALFASLLAEAVDTGAAGRASPAEDAEIELPPGGQSLPSGLPLTSQELLDLEAALVPGAWSGPGSGAQTLAAALHAFNQAGDVPLKGAAGQADPTLAWARDLLHRADAALRAEGVAPAPDALVARMEQLAYGMPAASQAYANAAAAALARAMPDANARAEALHGLMQRIDGASVDAGTHTVGPASSQPAPATGGGDRTVPVLPLNTPLHQQAQWGDELGDRVRWMVSNQMQTAELKITPPQLGTIEVRISVHKDQMNIVFSTPNAMTREALEDAVPRLREIMSGNGHEAVNVDVSQHSSPQQHDARTGSEGAGDTTGSDGPMANGEITIGQSRALGLVDLFA